MKRTIKITGCVGCPFKDNEFESCNILGDYGFPALCDSFAGVSVRDVEFGEFHEKCPLHDFTIEVIKDNN